MDKNVCFDNYNDLTKFARKALKDVDKEKLIDIVVANMYAASVNYYRKQTLEHAANLIGNIK